MKQKFIATVEFLENRSKKEIAAIFILPLGAVPAGFLLLLKYLKISARLKARSARLNAETK